MEEIVFGYILDENIIFDIKNNNLFQYDFLNSDVPVSLKVIKLNQTQSRLLLYLLNNKDNTVLKKDDIMVEVWDKYNLSSSTQRLWQCINELRRKLSYFNMSSDLIISIHRSGYKIDTKKVRVLYII